VSDSQQASQATEAPHPNRLYFLDNLRATVIVLVVVLHTFLTYMVYAPPWWYVLDTVRSVLFDWAVVLIDVPLMPVLFFLAGFFAFPSLERHGAGNFMRDKVVRIGIPWAFGVLFLAPLITYMIYVSRQVPVSYLQFLATDFWGPMYQQAVYWFLGVLFLFYALLSASYDESTRLRAWRRVIRAPSWRHFLVFGAIMTAAFFLLSLWWTPDDWRHVWLMVYQPVRFPLYIGYFCLGLYADRRGWFAPGGYEPGIGRWLPIFLVTGLLYAGHIMVQLFGPPGTLWHQAVTAVLFNAFCLAALMAGLSLFRASVNSQGRNWRSLACNSYGIYYLHPLILYPLAYLFVAFPLPIYVKAAALITLTLLACWALSEFVLTRAPGLRRAFGPGSAVRRSRPQVADNRQTQQSK
jgi:glucans biosynthesis protein C